jgi:4-amino-4-deoxy-L-arabinose transferase-like glycosyltransferase
MDAPVTEPEAAENGSPAPETSRWEQRRTAALVLLGLCGFHVLANLLWLLLDNHVVRIDEGFHVRGAQAYFDVLTSPFYGSNAERLGDLTEIFSPYPPALHVLGALLALVFGYSHDAIALSGTLCFLLVILGCYAIARRLLDRRYALLTAALVSLAPLLFASSRYVVLENLVAALVVWAVYALLRSDGFRNTRWVLVFAGLNGLAFLTKQNAFGYYLVPSAAVYGYGLWAAATNAVPWAVRRNDLGRLFMNGTLTVIVSAGIFLPWYYHHLPALEEYWLHEHKGGTTPFAFIEQTETSVEVPEEEPESASATEPAEAPVVGPEPGVAEDGPETEARPEQIVADLSEVFQERPWRRYFINFVNNGVFLPCFLLSMIGLAALLFQRRFWGQPLWLLLLWFFGSYIVMTLLFRHITPRYALPFLAPLAFAAAGALYSIPKRRLRRWATGGVLALLAIQFAHITFGPIVWPARLWVPLMTDSRTVRANLDEGLALYKDEVVVGTYTFKGPYRDINYVDRLFEKMRAQEEGLSTPDGTEVAYQSLWRQRNFGGLQLAERQYWPAPNPMLRTGLDDPGLAKYRFSNIQIGMSPEELMPTLDETRYVAVFLAQSATTELDGPHHRFYETLMGARPMHLIDYFAVPPYGKLPGAFVGLLAAKEISPETRPFNLFEMYDQNELSTMDADLAEAYRVNYAATFYQGIQWAPMNADISYGLISFRPVSELILRYKALFHCEQVMGEEWRLFVEAIDEQGGRYYWNATPDPPTTEWEPGEHYVLQRYVPLPSPGTYMVRLGFFRKVGADIVPHGDVISAGQLAF